MKKFLVRTAAFLLPVLLIFVLAEGYVRSIPCSYQYKDQWLETHGEKVSTLILGNSHAFFDLRPSAFADSTFNLSNVSQRLEHDAFLLKHYAKDCPNLRQVILVADNSNLFDLPMEDDEPGRVIYYQLYMHYQSASTPFASLGSWAPYPLELSYINSFWAKVTRHCLGMGISCDSLGWGIDDKVELRNPVDFEPERVRSHNFHNWTSTLRNVIDLYRIASWCQRHRISLVVLQTPVTQSYTQKAGKWQLDFVNSILNCCQQHFGAVVADYSCDTRFSDSDFFDTDHLNDQGATKFSNILSSEL